jgi:hypothetical protein
MLLQPVLLLIALSLADQPLATAAQPQASADKATMADVAWLAGSWKSASTDNNLPASEEIWSAPAANAMMGMFRMYQGDRIIIYEFLMLEQTPDGLFMRLRHFQSGMEGLEDKPIRLKLSSFSADKLVFDNPDGNQPKQIVYALQDGEQLAVTVTSVRDSSPETFTLNFQRSPK